MNFMLEPYDEDRERENAKTCGLLWLLVFAVGVIVWAIVCQPAVFGVGFAIALLVGLGAAR